PHCRRSGPRGLLPDGGEHGIRSFPQSRGTGRRIPPPVARHGILLRHGRRPGDWYDLFPGICTPQGADEAPGSGGGGRVPGVRDAPGTWKKPPVPDRGPGRAGPRTDPAQAPLGRTVEASGIPVPSRSTVLVRRGGVSRPGYPSPPHLLGPGPRVSVRRTVEAAGAPAPRDVDQRTPPL